MRRLFFVVERYGQNGVDRECFPDSRSRRLELLGFTLDERSLHLWADAKFPSIGGYEDNATAERHDTDDVHAIAEAATRVG